MLFTVKIHEPSCGVSELQIEAISVEDALRQARAQGHLAFAASAARTVVTRPTWFWLGRRTRFSLMLFSEQLLALLEAGMNLVEAIEALAENEPQTELRAVLHHVLERLRAGQSFSAAITSLPGTFPAFYVGTIAASERSGDIAPSLRRYLVFQRQIENVRKKTISALIYPTLLLVAGALVTAFLLGYVVPKFSRIYEERMDSLSWLSRLLMQWGAAFTQHGAVLTAAAAVLAALAAWAGTRATLRYWFWQRLWHAPGIGERLRLYQLARLYRTLGMLLRGGTTIVAALELVHGLLSASLHAPLAKAAGSIREGVSISEALQGSGLATPVAYRMLRVGEKSGRMGEMMDNVAAFYDGEVDRWIDVFTKVFEPLVMAVIGVVVGGIVILMYLPIFELAGSIQ